MLAFVSFQISPIRVGAQDGTTVTGRILAVDGGLPVAGAKVELEHGSSVVSTATTGNDGSFAFPSQTPGVYNLRVSAIGYQTSVSDDIIVLANESQVSAQLAIDRVAQSAMRTIASVRVSAHGSLQTTATINKNVDPQLLQSQDYMRAGDALATIPGVNISTSSAVGDDESVSIRGFKSGETATLLDGHPLGPISGFDYQDSPFFGLSNVQAIFGSGATGLYGASTIAGAIDFRTLTPSLEPHGLIEQGVGNDGKMLTGLQATGTFGKLGYATAYGVEGTCGMFCGQAVPQTGLLGTNLTTANVAANTYTVTGNNTLRNALLKLTYNFDATTNLALTGYSATSWDDKSGNGDTDENTYQYNLYTAQQGGPYPGCPNGQIPVNTDATGPNATTCMSYTQYAAAAAGPAGGGPQPWQAIRNQDYHARFSKTIASHTVTVDDYYDDYVTDYNRNFSGGFDAICNCYTGFFNTNFYRTNGLLVGDEFVTGKNDVSFGFYSQHQRHLADTANFDSTNHVMNITWNPEYDLNESAYYARDQYEANSKLTLFGDLWLKRSNASRKANFDPRFTVMFRPNASDVVRFTAGHDSSDPDPSSVYSPVSLEQNFNGITTCPGNKLNIAGGGDPTLTSETATDLEGAYGHRFKNDASVEVDVYSAQEQNAIFGGVIPFSQLGITLDPTYQAQLFARMQSVCHIANPTIDNLTASTKYNAAEGRYQGIELSGGLYIVPGLHLTGDYDVQSASYLGVPNSILLHNGSIINGAQISGTPLDKANAALDYANPHGFGMRVDGHYIGTNNGWNRPAFWFANANISNNVGPLTLNLGVNNLFNSAASDYGLIGLGTYSPVNSVYEAANGPQSALSEGSEEFGLPYRQVWLTVTRRF